jgi:vitamin K-dependent gamma-carboxylase-like protein
LRPRVTALWNAFWFPTTSALNLAAVRIVVVAVEMLFFFPSLKLQVNFAVRNSSFDLPQPLIRIVTSLVPREILFTPTGLTAVYGLAMAAGLLAVIGLWTRWSLLVYVLCYGFFVSHAYSYADVHHREALYFLFVLALAFSPAGERLSVDALLRRRRERRMGVPKPADQTDLAMWPLRLLHVLLAWTYFSTGITKLLVGGLQWMNGYTLQMAIFRNAISRAAWPTLGLWMVHNRTLCIVVSIATILFETFFFVSLFLPRLAPLFFAGGLLFHVMLYLTSGHPFFEHMLLNATMLVFYNTTWFPRLWERWTGALEAGLADTPVGAQ